MKNATARNMNTAASRGGKGSRVSGGKGATGVDGRDNRRVALVIDYAGTGVAAPM